MVRRSSCQVLACVGMMPVFRTVLLLFLCLLAAGASAHRFHHSLAEVAVNSEQQILEVALKVVPEDLETALQEQVGQRISLEKSDNIDTEILGYLSRALQFVDAGGTSLNLNWIGKEISHKAAWLYFEVPYNKPQTLHIKNTLLNGVSHGQQINAMVVSQNGEKKRLVFGGDDYNHTIVIQ